MAVAVRIFDQVILMIFLCLEELFERFDFDGDFPVVFFLFRGDPRLDRGKVGCIGVIDAGAVLRSGVVSLPVQADRVDNPEVMTKELVEADPGRIVGYFDGLRVPAVMINEVLIARIFGLPSLDRKSVV